MPGPRDVLLVVLAELLQHHPLLGTDAEGEEECERDAGGRVGHPVYRGEDPFPDRFLLDKLNVDGP